jgi:hypothetical protein
LQLFYVINYKYAILWWAMCIFSFFSLI